MNLNPIVSGLFTGFDGTALQLLEETTRLIEEVTTFRVEPRDFSAPKMELASSIPVVTLVERGKQVDLTA